MAIQLPLQQMSIADKLEAMELLWADLSKQPNALPSPAWHQSVLEERRQGVLSGELKFLDWDSAIADLRKELREDTAS
jgi:Putative addiction module component